MVSGIVPADCGGREDVGVSVVLKEDGSRTMQVFRRNSGALLAWSLNCEVKLLKEARHIKPGIEAL